MTTIQKEPTILATVTFQGSVSGNNVTKTYECTKEDINDIDWYGGETGDSVFDDLLNNDERFFKRVEELLSGLMYWDSDPETGGENEEFIGYGDILDFKINFKGFKVEDFAP